MTCEQAGSLSRAGRTLLWIILVPTCYGSTRSGSEFDVDDLTIKFQLRGSDADGGVRGRIFQVP